MLRIILVVLFSISSFIVRAQTCTALGQNPQTAFPVCGTSTFTQNTVPLCGNRNVTGPCGATGLTDRNPYWYKFTCFQTGTLGFVITPLAANEDYDWQLFDVTNVTNLDQVYTNLSLFVSCNWSSPYGPTGASAAGTVPYTCGGAIPLFTTMPTLVAGHNYLLLISHYTNTQSGYTLAFGGGTANITDTLTSHIIQATAPCDGTTINVKLNKKMRCASLAANGSDFQLNTTATTITGAIGFGCATGFDLDSLQLTLSAPLPAGTYRLKAKVGSDANTLFDICNTPMAVGDSADFTVATQAPVPMDSVRVPAGCSPQQLVLEFTGDIRCTTIAPDGSDFTITGPTPVVVNGAVGACNPNGLTRTITISLGSPIRSGGTYTIHLQNGTDGNTLLNNCLQPTPAGSTLNFSVRDAVSAAFTYSVAYNPCGVGDTVKYVHPGGNGVNSWAWTSNGGIPLPPFGQNATILYTTPGTYNTTLIVSNGVCRDTITLPVAINTITKDTILPKLASATAPCEGTQILLKLNKKIRCSTIAANGSDFTIRPALAAITSALGVGCNSTGETDSLVLSFAAGLPTGTYTLVIGNGSDGNTLADLCNRTIAVGDSIRNIQVVSHPLITMDSITRVGCKPIELFLVFKEPVRCSSIAANGSDFTVTGPSVVNISQAAANTCTNGFTSTIKLTLSSVITVGGTYTVTLKNGSDGNTLLNECNQPALTNLSRQFVAGDTVSAAFTYNVGYSCSGRDTVYFNNAGQNGINMWRWNFGNATTSSLQNPVAFYTTYGNIAVNLMVSNGFCSDSATQNIFIATDTLHPSFEAPSFLCPGEPARIVNHSTGDIVSYTWDFGDGFTFSGASPAVHTYATPASQRDYAIKLTITGSLGCSIDTTAVVKVLNNCVVAVPSGFTPNGDGLNDFLYPTNAYKADKLVFKVYNRFGQQIFEGRNATQKWDGKVNGTIQPTGTYVWFLNYIDTETEKAVSQKGTTVLIR